tara:strand:- start:5065 stop:5808 length:744 start_codon:yes stop_codon:yes gene_type:complete
MNTKILKQIGLTDSEIKVYLALLELGSSKKAPIVKKSKISSSKVYEVIDKLIDKGLASYVIKNKVKHFNAAPPSRIKNYLKQKEKTLKQQKREFDKLLPSLELRQTLTQKGSDAEIYKGWKGMTTVYNDLLESLRRGDKYYIFGASKGIDTKKVKSFYSRFNKKAEKKKLKAHIIFNENARGNIPNVEKKSKVKYLDQTTPSEILIYKNKTAIVLLEKEPLIILIRGESIARSFRSYFNVMWMMAKK